MGKFTKKLRKFAKKAAPLAMLGLGAAALMKRRKAKALNAITDYGDTGTLSGKAGYEGDFGYHTPKRSSVLAHPGINRITDYYGENLKKGGRVGCGKAKRGFGRALKKK
jgi:hypothetical protein